MNEYNEDPYIYIKFTNNNGVEQFVEFATNKDLDEQWEKRTGKFWEFTDIDGDTIGINSDHIFSYEKVYDEPGQPEENS